MNRAPHRDHRTRWVPRVAHGHHHTVDNDCNGKRHATVLLRTTRFTGIVRERGGCPSIWAISASTIS